MLFTGVREGAREGQRGTVSAWRPLKGRRLGVVAICLIALVPAAAKAVNSPPTTTAVSGKPYTTPQCQSRGTDGEVSVAVDAASGRRVAVWMQDIEGLGDPGGLPLDSTDVLAASSADGVTWTTPIEPSGVMLCEVPPGVNDVSGDPSVSVGPDGRWYLSVLTADGVPGVPATDARVFVRTSADGVTWSPVAAQVPDPGDDDFPSIVSDPSTARRAWVVTTSYPLTVVAAGVAAQGPPQQSQIVISATTDGGTTFSTPKTIHETATGVLDVAARLVAFDDGGLLAVFAETPASTAETGNGPMALYATRSSDHGVTWSAPVMIGSGNFANITDPVTGTVYEPHCCTFSLAAGRKHKAALTWTTQLAGGMSEVNIASSSDAGASWSIVDIPRAKPAFVPSVAITEQGIAATWYDFTGPSAAGQSRSTTLWAASSAGNSGVFEIKPLAGPFDLKTAALFGAGYLGDYQSLVAVGDRFEATFTIGMPVARNGPTDIFTVTF
jgi:hypothetical protein